MSKKRTVEIFSAGCGLCDDAIELVNKIGCNSCEITVLNMQEPDVSARAKSLGINAVPAVVIDGKLADCCRAGGIDEATLRTEGLGQPIS